MSEKDSNVTQGGGDIRFRGSVNDDGNSIGAPSITMETVGLKKRVGLASGVSLIVGTMIGSGIFISPKGVLSQTGSVGASLLVWAGCGIISMLGALCYAELGTMIHRSGAEYAYIGDAFGPVPAYMYAWTSIIVTRGSSLAIICLAFSEYATSPMFDGCGPPVVITKLLTAAAIMLVSTVNIISVRLAARVQIVFTVAKLAALIIIIIGGLVKLGQGETQYLQNSFEGSTSNPSLIALAFYSGLWAYDGWNNLNFVTEEIEKPNRNLPLSIVIALPLVTVVYLLTNISYLTVMSRDELLAAPAVASLWGDRVLKGAALIIPISVACSTFGAANGSAFTAGRLVYAAAQKGHLPDVMAYVNVKQYTPMPSLIVNMILALIMIIPGDIESLIDFFSFTSWIFYAMTGVALIVMRFTKRDIKRPYKVPLPIPIIFVLCSLYLVIGPIIDQPKVEFLYATIFIFSGLIFYVPFVHFKLKVPGIDRFTEWVQLLVQVAPSQVEPAE